MEANEYLSQIGMNLFYFQHMHNSYPEAIFMSYPLFDMIADSEKVVYYSDGRKRYCGVPIETYRSDKLEYYFAVNKNEF